MYETLKFTEMTTRRVIDAKDKDGEKVYVKGHAKATYMSDGRTVDEAVNNKVDKVDGKQLSTEDFTTLLKQKLDGLSNYDDTDIQAAVSKLRTDLDTLVSGDTTTAIKTFNEVIAFLYGISDTENLSGIISSIEQQIAAKQDKITDLQTIREGAAKGATAIQSHQDISGKQDKLVSGTNIKTVNGESILGSGNIEISGGGSASGAYLPLTGGTLTGPVVFKNGGRISVDSDDNLNVSIDETLYIDNDVRSTYGSVTLEEGVFEYANAEGGYTKATGVAFKSVTSMSDTVTLRDDIFYDFTAAVNGDVSFVLGTAMGSGHYMFRIYVPSGYSIALPATLYFFGDEPTEAGCVYEVSIYRGVTVCVKIGQKNVMGGQ